MALTLSSPSFQDHGSIPSVYTCDGQNISPPLQWTNIPHGTCSFVLICDDPDAPMGTWDHWILFNIPEKVTHLEGDIKTLPPGTRQGLTSFQDLGYGGPCPPSGQHRYFFKLYALDATLNLAEGASKTDVEAALKKHVLDETSLVGLYQRS